MEYSKKYINQTVLIKIDRPLGTKHPTHDFIYELNYGFVPETLAPDGEEIDAYVLGVSEPIDTFEGVCIAVLHRTNDNDDKLIVVPQGQQYSDEQIQSMTAFQEKFFTSKIIRS